MPAIVEEPSSGTVTLSNGVAPMVEDAGITRWSVISTSVETPSGLLGVLSVDIQHGIGFTIQSSSAYDQSTVQYAVTKY